MASRVRRVVGWILLVVFLLVAFLFASEMSVAWYRRWQASRILACVKRMRPGVTTEAQAESELDTFSAYDAGLLRDRTGYGFYNGTEWLWTLASHLPMPLAERLTLPWTFFSVQVGYRDGLVAEIRISEMQDDLAWIARPNSAMVEVLWSRVEGERQVAPVNRDFNGYSVFSRSGVAVNKNGKPTGVECCRERFITLDERATTQQLAESEDFQLQCMTSFRHCSSDRDILP
jgi:hypothetical protein